MALPYDITVQPAGGASFTAVPAMPLSATIQSGGAAPASVPVAITSSGSWTAASGATWLKLSATSGSGNASLTVSYDASGLAAGTYNTSLSVSSGGDTLTLPATLTVLPPTLTLDKGSLTFTAINGAPIASQIVALDTDVKITTPWNANSNTPWLSISPTSGTTPATAVLTVDPTVGTLASGSYPGSITITPTGLAVRQLPVTLNLTPATLQASVQTLTLGGTYGRDFSSTQVAQTLNMTLNTSTNSWPWTFTNVPLWASASTSGGTINAAGASVSFKGIAANAPVGANSGLVNAAAQVNGDSVRATVLFYMNKDQHKLLPSETAVAFVSTPTWKKITRTITVSDNYGTFGGMSATSDQSWLVAAVSGNQLTLTADASQMLNDTLSNATITLTALDPDATAPEPIRVALWERHGCAQALPAKPACPTPPSSPMPPGRTPMPTMAASTSTSTTSTPASRTPASPASRPIWATWRSARTVTCCTWWTSTTAASPSSTWPRVSSRTSCRWQWAALPPPASS